MVSPLYVSYATHGSTHYREPVLTRLITIT
jgi:hypothetical protein